MIINHNIPALSTYSKLTANNKARASSLNKLSSGQQINTAADDASGLAISEKMRAQIRGLDQASVNAQDGISLIQSAEGNLGETEEILQRMRELAVKSANSTKVASDRDEIQKEINQLTSEINRIGNTTEFNTQKLLNGGGTETNYSGSQVQAGGLGGKLSGFFQNAAGVSAVAGIATITIGASLATGVAIGKVTVGKYTVNVGTVPGGGITSATANAAAILSALKGEKGFNDDYTIVHSTGGVITITENKASGATMGVVASGGAAVNSATVSSVKEELGSWEFKLDEAIGKKGVTMVVGGVRLTSTDNVPPRAGEFAISDDKAAQAIEIARAINSDTNLKDKYDASADSDGVITLTQRAGEGTAVAANLPTSAALAGSLSGAATGIADIDINSLVKAGGKFTINGKDIAVVDDKSDKRLATGEAILATESLTEQTKSLVAAINANVHLKGMVGATVQGGTGIRLTQKAGSEAMELPTITSNTSSTNGFEAKLQIGANSFQSMTVKISDMRAAALGIVGEKASDTITSEKNGAKAQYTAVKNVNNGTDDESVQYALDVSTHEKATAAISIFNDAIETVSAERSRLGAYQNRLDHTINNLTVSSQNMTDAESRIRDTDMAKEMMTFQKNGILSQAAQSMLAQANQLPQGVLQLLQ